jgi:hypothetical protein
MNLVEVRYRTARDHGREEADQDCFAIALAAEEGALLLTGDPEIIDRADLRR